MAATRVDVGTTPQSTQKRIERRLSRRFQVDLVLEGALVGIVGGGVVTLYRVFLTGAERVLRQLIALAWTGLVPLLGLAAVVALSCLVVGWLMRWEPYTQGSGIPQVDAEVAGHIDMPWWRVMAAKFAEGTLCALGGLSLGREGPSVQLGGMSGKAVSKALGRSRGEERLLVTCGAAAGMSAAFNAPLTGVLFALEEIHKEFTAPLIISVMASSVASDLFVSGILGVSPVLQFVFTKDLPHAYYPFVLALGVFCGLLGALHNLGMFACSERIYSKVRGHLPYSRIWVAFALSLVMCFAAPDLLCGGDAIVERVMEPGVLPFATIAALLVGKYAFTTICFGSGAPGGTLFPLCVMGILCGGLFGVAAFQWMGLPTEYVTNFVVLGIAGLFSSVVRAPVTGVVLAFELTGSLDALLSVSIVSIVSYVTANLTDVDPFYEHLLGNLLGTTPKVLGRGGQPGEKVLHEHTVGAGSKAEGKALKDINWPAGARVVMVSRAGGDVVPTGDTVLETMDDLLVVMDIEHEDEAQEALWNLCRGGITTRRSPRG